MGLNQVDEFDAEELLHLAVHAGEKERRDEALGYLKRALAIEPNNPRAHYLLGAEYAQIGLYPRAITEMSRAVELAPDLYPAIFQLGLLHLTSGQPQEADNVWNGLDPLGTEHPLWIFKTGLLHLAKDEFGQCLDYLRRGLAISEIDESLRSNMQKVLKKVELVTPATTPERPDEAGPAGRHLFASAYHREEDDNGDQH